jgi:transcriptional regulator with XRE-family HTH domain
MAKPSPSHAKCPALVKLGSALRSLRLEMSISQEELANIAGIDRSYMGGVERGEHNISVVNLLCISKALGITLEKLFSKASL